MRFIRLAVAASALMLAATVAAAGEATPQVVQYRLDNGLEVLLAPDHKVPKVGMALIYRVGGMNEPAGRSGFAHLFEHLMFSGTTEYPRIDDTYSALGISNNAYTEEDRTSFVEDALASTLPVLLSVEADRMANLGDNVDQHELDVQRDVVKNEMRQTVLDRPGGAGGEAFRAALFPKPHPYAESVIGSMADLDAAQLSDVKGFFDTFYVPNNAILSLAGDFDVAAAKAMIADTFGRVPRGAAVVLPTPEAPKPAAVRLAFSDRLPAELVALGVAGPAVGGKESTALLLASDLLGNYEYGVLRRVLVNTGLATSAGADWSPGRLGGRFSISATAAPGVTPAALEAAMRQAIRDFAASDFAAADVERARNTLKIGRRLAGEAMLDRAQALATRYDLYGANSPGLGDDPILEALTPADVEAAFRAVVVPEALSVMTIAPGPQGDYPAVLTASSGVATPIAVPPRPAVEVPMLAAGEPGKAVLPPMQTATLSNGIRVVHYEIAGSPRVAVAASVTGGSNCDDAGREGLIGITADLMSRGAGTRDFDSFSKAAKDIGADVSGQASAQQTAMVLSVGPEDFAAGVALLADAVQRPRLDPAEWASLKAEVMQSLVYRDADPGSRAYLALQDEVFPVAPGEPGPQATQASVGALSLDDIKAMHQKLFTPQAMTIYTVGSLSLDAVVAALEPAFGGWHSDGPGLVAVPQPSAVFRTGLKVIVAPSTGASQSIILVSRPAPAFNDPGVVEAIAVAELLGGSFTSRLNQVLREAKGYSYGVNASVWTNIPTGGMLTVSAPVQADKVGAALAEIIAGFEGLLTMPVTEAELTRTVMASAKDSAGAVETSSGLFGFVMAASGMGLTAEELNNRLEQMVALQLPAVDAEARKLAGLEPAVVVISGDPASILPQLQAIGLGDVTVLPAAP